jgi:hypothetical protein
MLDAKQILAELGLPPAQQNEMSALTLLVLAQLDETNTWSQANRAAMRIHDILQVMRTMFGREYAENTRETVRRQVIHQFEQAGIVERNPEEGGLPTNSPRTRYALTQIVVNLLRAYGSSAWRESLEDFKKVNPSLQEKYQQKRSFQRIPVTYQGREFTLSAGAHNRLQSDVILGFAPRFAPGSKLVYLGDAARKRLIVDEATFKILGLPVPDHDKLPDVILFDDTRNWLFLIEAVISHGAVSPKRYFELEKVFGDCAAGRIYVTAFSNATTFRRFVAEIAWETEVWIAESPDHLIHFNGDRFLGPHN